MRVTPNITAQNSLYNLQQSRTLLDQLQEKVASGKNYNRPSDDPVAARQLVAFGDQLQNNEQYASNMTKSSTWLKVTETALEGMDSTMSEIKKLVATLTNGTDMEQVRQNAVSQLATYKKQLVDYGNTQLNNIYIFGGTNNLTTAFSGSNFNGNDENIDVEMGSSIAQTMNVTGGRVLKGSPSDYGSVDILQRLDDLITAVQNNDAAGIVTGAQQMEAGAQQIQNAISDVGSRLSRINNMQTFNSTTKNVIQGVVSNIQNVDYAKLAVEMQQQQLAFQATLSSTAKISQMSLLDYL